ncbi:MAG: hypothetical protein V4773_10155 [Verrucomicrobiota bacterium]
MKPLLSILAALSLCANIALVALLFAGRGESASTAAASGEAAGKAKAAAPAASSGADMWTNLTAEDLPTMVQRLRTAGAPPEFIRALAAARLSETFAARFKALRGDAASKPFWKNSTNVDPTIRNAEMKLYREQQKALRDLLGADAESPETSVYQQRRFETVPPDKVDEVKDALRLFEEKRQEVFSAMMGTYTPDMQRKIQALEKEHQATLASILPPDQLLEYNIRNSDTAQQLRSNLAAFNPTEEEFRALYKLQSQREPEIYTPNMSQEEIKRMSENQRVLREQIQATLGPVRGAEYERATDYQYRQASQLVSRLELPADTTNKLWDVKKDIETRANALRRDSSLAPAARTQQLAALAQEGTQRVQQLVGTRGVEPYKQYGGNWLQSLTPRPGGPGGTTTTTTTIIRTPGP